MLVSARAAPGRPADVVHFGEDPLGQLVTGPREPERDVRVQALELGGVGRAADPEVERCAAVATRRPARKISPHAPLLLRCGRESGRERRIGCDGLAPALDRPRGLEARDRGDEVPARQVVRRRERLAGRRVGQLLGDRGASERTARRDAMEGAYGPAELALDDLAVAGHPPEGSGVYFEVARCARFQAGMPLMM